MNNEKRWENIFEKAVEGSKVNEVTTFDEVVRLNSLIELTEQSRTLPHSSFPEQRRLILAASLKQHLQNSAAIQIAKTDQATPVVTPRIQNLTPKLAPEPRRRMGWRVFLSFQQAFVVLFLVLAAGVIVYSAARPEITALPTTIPAAATRPPEEATPTPPSVATATLDLVTITVQVTPPAPVIIPAPTEEPSPTSQPTPTPTTVVSTATKTIAPVVVRTTAKPAPTATKKAEVTSAPTPTPTTKVEATATVLPTTAPTGSPEPTTTPEPTDTAVPTTPKPTLKPTPKGTPTEDDERETTPGHH